MDKVDIYLNELKLCVLGERRNCLRNFEHGANDVMARISEVPSRIVRIDRMEEGKGRLEGLPELFQCQQCIIHPALMARLDHRLYFNRV